MRYQGYAQRALLVGMGHLGDKNKLDPRFPNPCVEVAQRSLSPLSVSDYCLYFIYVLFAQYKKTIQYPY